jgi:hypothetical protein
MHVMTRFDVPAAPATWPNSNHILIMSKFWDSSSKARAKLDHDLGGEKNIQQCVMLPHDIIASMFDFNNAEVFYHLWVGAPGDAFLYVSSR